MGGVIAQPLPPRPQAGMGGVIAQPLPPRPQAVWGESRRRQAWAAWSHSLSPLGRRPSGGSPAAGGEGGVSEANS
jgi:hypothetical protein